MRLLFLLGLLILCFSTSVHCADCESKKWVKEGIRTQGGGWIWFLGHGSGSTSQKAFFMAEGQALDRLLKECGGIHQEVKFIERCEEKKSDLFKVYARASVKHGDCNKFKYGHGSKTAKNEELHKRHEKYLNEAVNSLELSYDGCNKRLSGKCSIYSIKERSEKNLDRAEKIAFFGCRKSDERSCFEYTLIKFLQKQEFYASAKLTCELAGAETCYNRGLVENNLKHNTLGEYYIRLACLDGFFQGCQLLGTISDEKGEYKEASKFFLKACKNQFKDSCRDGEEVALKLKDERLQKKFQRRGCDLGIEEFCKVLGIKKKKIKNSDSYINDKSGKSIQMLEL